MAEGMAIVRRKLAMAAEVKSRKKAMAKTAMEHHFSQAARGGMARPITTHRSFCTIYG